MHDLFVQNYTSIIRGSPTANVSRDNVVKNLLSISFHLIVLNLDYCMVQILKVKNFDKSRLGNFDE